MFCLSFFFQPLNIGFFGYENMEEFLSIGSLSKKDKLIGLIMLSARHKHIKDALLYIQDIAHRLARSKALGITGNEVGTWQPIQLIFDIAANQVNYKSVKHLILSLSELVDRFITKNLKISNIQDYTYSDLLVLAEQDWTRSYHPEKFLLNSKDSGRMSVCPHCNLGSTPDSRKRDSESIDDLLSQGNGKKSRVSKNSSDSTVLTVNSDSSSSSKEDKRSKQFHLLFDEYLKLKGNKKEILRRKLDIIVDVYKKVKVLKTLTLLKDSKAFYYRHGFTVIYKCLNKCYKGDIDLFLSNIPDKKGIYDYKCSTGNCRKKT